MRIVSLVALAVSVGCVPNEPSGGQKVEPGPTPSARPKATPKAGASAGPRPPRLGANRERGGATQSLDPLVAAPFRDEFERPEPGADWTLTSPAWRIADGQLCVQGAKNHPAWLKRRLPRNARIEFDATSSSPDGDIKAEVFGDGRGQAQGATYDHATSYLVIFGGWQNRFHVLARIDEHGKDRKELRIDPTSTDPRAMRVAPNQTYHFKIERADGRTLRWYVDDLEMHAFEDPAPLVGRGHDHFGFNDWDVRVCFDNLVVTPL